MVVQALAPVAGPEQGEFESGEAGRLRRQRAGGQGAQFPARFRCARPRLRGDSRQQERHAGCARGKRQAPAGREIIGRVLATEFEENHAEACAARAFQPGLKGGPGILRAQDHQACRVEPEFAQARRMGVARFPVEGLLPHPEAGAPLRENLPDGQRAAAQGRRIARAGGIEFMQGAAGKSGQARNARSFFPPLAGGRGPALSQGKRVCLHGQCSYFVLVKRATGTRVKRGESGGGHRPWRAARQSARPAALQGRQAP